MTISDDHRREMMKKRLLGILFSFALMICMMPAPGVNQTAYAEDHTYDGITFDPWTSNNSLPATAGSYFLENNVTLTSKWNVPAGTVNLCLNGKKISCTEAIIDEVCRVGSGSTLNLYDETADEGCIQGNNNTDGVVVEGAFTMNGGTIRDCGGDGVEVDLSGSVSGAVFTMNGGTIKQCGYGVNAGREFVMNGGTVTKNEFGVNVNPSGTFSVSGSPVIAGNTQHDLILKKDGGSYPKVALGGALTDGADIRVEISDNSQNYGDIFTVSTGDIKAKDYIKYFKSGSDKYTVKANDNELELAEVTTYPLWIKGIQVTDTNKGNVLGDGKVSYDPETNTLTLDGANITADNEKQHNFSAIHYGDTANELIIDAKKDSTVTGASYDDTKETTSYGISSESRVTVCGKLTAAGGKAGISAGVFAPAFVVEDKAEAKVQGDSSGVFISDKGSSITVRGKLTAEGDDYGIYFYPDSTGSGRVTSVTVNNGAELTATGGRIGIIPNSQNGYVEIKKGAKVRAAGAGTYGAAVSGTVKNAVPGLGWTDPEGTEGKTFFDIDTQGRELGENIKCAEFPAPAASVKTAPEAKDRKYTGQEQVLVTEGKAEGGTMQYALGKDGTTPPERGWSTSVPAGKDIGVYYVWYKAVGDNAHIDSAAACVTVTISEKGPDSDESTVTFDLNGGTLDGQTGTVVKKYENGTVITLPAPVRDGYTFDYWEGSRYNAGDKYIVDGDHTFTAVWKTGAGGGSDSGTGSGSSSGKSGVKTGDDNALAAWIVLLLAALGGTTGMVFARKRKGE